MRYKLPSGNAELVVEDGEYLLYVDTERFPKLCQEDYKRILFDAMKELLKQKQKYSDGVGV